MKAALIDTDILSLYFRGNDAVVRNFSLYLAEHRRISLSIITYYEILSGLKHRDAQKQIGLFEKFCKQNNVLPLSIESVNISAENMRNYGNKGLQSTT